MRFPQREKGQGLVEYALLLVLVAIVVIAILVVLGDQVRTVFAQITYYLQRRSITPGLVYTISSASASCQASQNNTRITVNFDVNVKEENTQNPVNGEEVTALVTASGGSVTHRLNTVNGVAEFRSLPVLVTNCPDSVIIIAGDAMASVSL